MNKYVEKEKRKISLELEKCKTKRDFYKNKRLKYKKLAKQFFDKSNNLEQGTKKAIKINSKMWKYKEIEEYYISKIYELNELILVYKYMLSFGEFKDE